MKRSRLHNFPMSLRARATTWYVGLLAVALLVFSVGIYVGLRAYLKQSVQRTLAGIAQTIATDLISKEPSKGEAWVAGELRESFQASTPSHRFVRVSSASRVIYQTADLQEPSLSVNAIALPTPAETKPSFEQQTVNGQALMVYALPYSSADGKLFWVEAGTSLRTMQQTLGTLLKILSLATILILVAATVGGYLLMDRPLRPLVALTEKAERIGHKELGERLPVIATGDELERLTHALNGMIDRLEEALDHNYRFSADASHELRTPLTIMRGEMEEILQLEDLPAQAVDNLVSTLEEIERMSRIVNSLMTITRLDAGGERMDLQRVDLSSLVRTTMEHMRLLAEEKCLPLTFACERDIFVYADPMRLKQVLVNLVDNAIKYTPSAEPASTDAGDAGAAGSGAIDVTVYADDSQAVLKVVDHGVGIAPETVPFVFDRFYRADYARSRGAGGVGLGLAIVKAIVTAHDGTVSIMSTPGHGSTVVVHLPFAVHTDSADNDPQPPHRRAARSALVSEGALEHANKM